MRKFPVWIKLAHFFKLKANKLTKKQKIKMNKKQNKKQKKGKKQTLMTNYLQFATQQTLILL